LETVFPEFILLKHPIFSLFFWIFPHPQPVFPAEVPVREVGQASKATSQHCKAQQTNGRTSHLLVLGFSRIDSIHDKKLSPCIHRIHHAIINLQSIQNLFICIQSLFKAGTQIGWKT